MSQNLERDAKELCRLLNLINTPASKQQLPSIDFESQSLSKSLQWPAPQPKSGAYQHQSTEALALEQFSTKYQTERSFGDHAQQKYFRDIFAALTKQRLCNHQWTEHAPSENILRVLVCLRIMMRDVNYMKIFFDLNGVRLLAEHLQKATDSYLTYGDGPFVVDILKEMTNIFQKLSAKVEQREWLIACGTHKALILLLSATDVIVLHCSLYALISLSQSPDPRRAIGELNSVEVLLRILQDYDIMSKKLSAILLKNLLSDPQVKEMVKVYDGVPILLSLLHNDNIKLLWSVLWCLVQLASDPETSNDIRQMGGIPLLLSMLHERKFVSERSSVSNGLASATIHGRTPHSTIDEEDIFASLLLKDSTRDSQSITKGKTEEMKEQQLSLKSACCAALTELVLNDTNAQQITQNNGIFFIGQLILPQDGTEKDQKTFDTLQKNAFRALRFLFSMERNRQLFKRLFPADLFEVFIDIGHYVRDLNTYKPVVEKINSLSKEKVDEIEENLIAANQNREPTKFVADYAVMETLGSGAFGCVYKVKKAAAQSFLALKEIYLINPSFGRSKKERDKSVGEMISELTIIKEQMKHPNVVRYHKTFVEDEKLFILMELIEGAPIREHFNSLKEKKEKFSEERIWNIFIQMVLALRYLHKEKHIVHRDLTPNNIMLGENDKVVITDFGLAKHKQTDTSKMTSAVGTILYSCPEIVKNEPYTDKADVWSIGCILYQMCALNPPFYSSNMLSLAKTIVEAEYKPLREGEYSNKVVDSIKSCLTADPDDRPDILGVAGLISDVMLVHMDNLRLQQVRMEKKLDRERKRTQRHFNEANKNMQNYHRLFLASQERYDKLVNLAGSGGGSSIKDGELSDNVFSDSEGVESKFRQLMLKNHIKNGIPEENDDKVNWQMGSDDDISSSGSDSRESSTGSAAILGLNLNKMDDGKFVVPQPPRTPRGRHRKTDHLAQQLSLDIPSNNTAPCKSSRDSGIGSSEPSPNNSQVVGNGNLDTVKHHPTSIHRSLSMGSTSASASSSASEGRKVSSGVKGRPNSSSNAATLTISPRKVRQINDPILQMLNQLHKIIYITQLPPTLCHNPRRRVIERFKRALFAPQSTSFNLKNELKRLLNGSRDMIDLNFGPGESPLSTRQPGESPLLTRQTSLEQDNSQTDKHAWHSVDVDSTDFGVTYEQMQNIIESVLVESGYYDMSPNAQHKRVPLAPIGGSDSWLLRTTTIAER